MALKIRPYEKKDRQDVLHIHWETGFLGRSMSKIYTNKKRWAKRASYYVDEEPESIVVLEDTKKKKVVGYVFGHLEDKKHNVTKRFLKECFFQIIEYPFMSNKDKRFARNTFQMVWTFLKGKAEEERLKSPEGAKELHINLLPEARGKGVGSKLIKKFSNYAKSKGVKIIQADSFQTKLNPNQNFWKKNGFREYTKAKTIYWKLYYPNEDIKICFYVKKL